VEGAALLVRLEHHQDGRLDNCEIDDDVQVTSFTPSGVECLMELLAEVAIESKALAVCS